MTREERKQARIDRLKGLAEKAREQSQQAYKQSSEMVKHIPPGQPILVGHHSESRHRRTLDRSWNKLGESVKLDEKAEEYERRAEAAANNDAIYTEDEDAEERLRQRIIALEKLQETMKAANKIIRSKKWTEDEKLKRLIEAGMTEDGAREAMIPDCFGIRGFASFELTNNGAKIRKAKERLEEVIRLKSTETKTYEINGVKVVENTQANRLQLFFSGKPTDEIRTFLKRNGFRWAPSEKCWQSYLKRWQVKVAKELLQPLEKPE